VLELKPEGQDEHQHPFDERLALARQQNVGGFVLKIDGDGPVFPHRVGRCAHVSPLYHQASSAGET
jgi:hypothetical protein